MQQPIRVLHVIGVMDRGGAESMIMNLYRKIDRTRVQFDFVENTFKHAAYDDEIESLGGRIYHCPHYNGKNHFSYMKWWNEFFQDHSNEYRIIHGHIGSTAAIYLEIANKYGLYTIAHSHSSGTDHSLKMMLFNILSRPTRNIADWFFACSQAAGVDRFGHKVISCNRYKVLNNAVDTSRFHYDPTVREAMRKELGWEDKKIFVHIGRFTAEKNHQFVLRIFREILNKDPNCKLMMVGDGPLRSNMEVLAKELGISDEVLFAGVRSDVSRLVQAMDLLIFPSLYEGLPVTLVEAQTAGLPCVISDHIPLECILTQNLVTVMSLEDSAESWAQHCLYRIGETRYDRSPEIIEKGYDITATARWLEEFYLEKYQRA